MVNLHPIRNLNTHHGEDKSVDAVQPLPVPTGDSHLMRHTAPAMKFVTCLLPRMLRVEHGMRVVCQEVPSRANLPSQDSSEFVVQETFVQVFSRRKFLDLLQYWLLIRRCIAHSLVWVNVRGLGVCGSIPRPRLYNLQLS